MRVFVASLIAMSVLATGASADGFKRIMTEAEYLSIVAGKNYCNETGCWKARKNGRMTGKFGKAKFKAKWKWHKGFGCRSGTLGGKKVPDDCQLFEVSGKKLRVTRNQGRGKQVVYSHN
ncbi:hypothetical protein BCF46_1434 [Litoreibacter meonggei]|uniref:DUF995 domain-containing protein n=1 Tax=Litoreibacter meonggei TaxID=1049199 RepID=A0A497X1U2_9RHOB|nr:hypothetical protein [Litoreibacter meonggei]RLJ59286.1 hypothetical protein BCF46_1434 [Litoreibacter meonggei]